MTITRLTRALGTLQLFIGLGAVGGGVGLVLAPSGEILGIPRDLLRDSPFTSYLIPGIVLLAVNGVGSLVAAAVSFTRRRRAGTMAMALGLFLVAWIAAQVYWFAGVHWLHVLYLALGLLECALGWTLRRQLVQRLPGSRERQSSGAFSGRSARRTKA